MKGHLYTMTNGKSIALVGCGIWGRKILRDLLLLKCTVTVIDQSESVKNLVAGMDGVDYLKEIGSQFFDGYVVATPSATHRSVISQLLPLGRPIFVEKPLTTSLADALAIPAEAAELVFLMHVWQYHPGIRAMANLARTQGLGKVLGLRTTRANWTSPRRDTDSLWNLMPHDLTIAKAIFGFIPRPKAVLAERHEGVIRGLSTLLGGDPYLITEVSNRYERKIREVRLHCAEGVAILKDERVDHLSIYRGRADDPDSQPTEERLPFTGPSALFAELKEFINYLSGGTLPACTFTDGMEVVRTLHELEILSQK